MPGLLNANSPQAAGIAFQRNDGPSRRDRAKAWRWGGETLAEMNASAFGNDECFDQKLADACAEQGDRIGG